MTTCRLLAIIILLQASGGRSTSAQTAAAASITAEELRGHVYFLASDWLQGRGVDTDGYRRAAEYAATQFAAAGLSPAWHDYLQPFRLAPGGHGGDSLTSWNVVAISRGSDAALDDQFVIVTAHLDHLGIRDGEVYNGANDNATGNAVVLEVAEALRATPTRRPVLFVLFGAEEAGMLGSEFFVDHSPFPLNHAVADINIDGVGYYVNQPPGQLRLLGLVGDRCEALRELVEDHASESGSVFVVTGDTQNLLRRSDQWRFIERGVPAAMFTDFGGGTYHLPSDDASPIEYDKLETLARFLYGVTVDLANRAEPICG